MADQISAEDFLKGQDVPTTPSTPTSSNTGPSSRPFKEQDYVAYKRLLRGKNTTPEQLSNWLEAKGYGKSKNAAEVLAFVRKNPNATIPNTYVGGPQDAPQQEEESWGHSIAAGAADVFSGIGEGWDNAQNNLTGLLLRGTDALGLTEGRHDKFNQVREEVAAPYQDSRYVHPDGWSRTIGNLGGEAVALAPLAEVKAVQALGKTGKAAKYLDNAIQGALGGAAVSGGDNITENALIGAVAAPAFMAVIDSVAAPTAKWLVGKYRGGTLEKAVSEGFDPSELPEGVSVDEAKAAIEKLRGVSEEAKAFKPTPEPTPETAFKPTEQEALSTLEAKLAQEAEAFQGDKPTYYHGTTQVFDQYSPETGGRLGDGVFLTTDRDYAEGFARERPDLFFKPEELGGGPASTPIASNGNIRHNTVNVSNTYKWNPETDNASPSFLKKLREEGYDSIETSTGDGKPELFVFDPKNIKTTKIEKLTQDSTGKITRTEANAEFKDLTTPPKVLTPKELEKKLTQEAEAFVAQKEAAEAAQTSKATPVAEDGITATTEAPVATPAEEVMTKLTDAIDRAASIEAKVQKKLYHQARRERLAKAKAVREQYPGEEGHQKSLAILKGELPKADFEGIRDQFTPEDVTTLFDHLSNHPELRGFETINAQTALAKLLDGQLPTASEIKLLDRVFPPDFLKNVLRKRSFMSKVGDATANALNLPRSLMATFDLSAPFTQGAFLVGRKEFWKSFGSMFKAFGSERSYEATMSNILNDANYPWMQEAKLAITDIHGTLTQREEQFMSQWAEKIPGIGRVVKASERGYTAFLNKLRADTFNSILEKAKTAGIKLEDEPDFVKSLGKFINDATGRGDLGRFNSASPLLSAGLFSPRLMASRVNLLNPVNYAKMHPTVRKEAIKSLLSFGGIATTVLTLAQAGGADVETDPRSSDFAKIRIGNTRYNILGGFGPYLTLASRLYTNERKTLKGEVLQMGTPKSKFDGSGNRLTTGADFIRSKLSPLASFAADWAAGSNVIGEPFEVRQAIVSRFVPLFLQDLNDLIKEEGPAKGSLMAVPGFFGLNASTYQPKVNKKDFMKGEDLKPAADAPKEISAEDFLKGEDVNE